MRKCPVCKKEYEGYPSTSRRDNKTEICNDCGNQEAFEDVGLALPKGGVRMLSDEQRGKLVNVTRDDRFADAGYILLPDPPICPITGQPKPIPVLSDDGRSKLGEIAIDQLMKL